MAGPSSSIKPKFSMSQEQEDELVECFTKKRSPAILFATEMMSLVMKESGQIFVNFKNLITHEKRYPSFFNDAMKKLVKVTIQKQRSEVKMMLNKHCNMIHPNYELFRSFVNEITRDGEVMIFSKKYDFFFFSILLSMMCTIAFKSGLLKAPRLGVLLICRIRSSRLLSSSLFWDDLKAKVNTNIEIAGFVEKDSKINKSSSVSEEIERLIQKLSAAKMQPNQSTSSDYTMTNRSISSLQNEPYGTGGVQKSPRIMNSPYCRVLPSSRNEPYGSGRISGIANPSLENSSKIKIHTVMTQEEEQELVEECTRTNSQQYIFSVAMMSIVMQEYGQKFKNYFFTRRHNPSPINDAIKNLSRHLIVKYGTALEKTVKLHCNMKQPCYEEFRTYANAAALNIENILDNISEFLFASIMLAIVCTYANRNGLLKAPDLGIVLIYRTLCNRVQFYEELWDDFKAMAHRVNMMFEEETFDDKGSKISEISAIFGGIASESRKYETRAEKSQLKQATSSDYPTADKRIPNSRKEFYGAGSKIIERSTISDKIYREIRPKPKQSTSSDYPMTDKRISSSRTEPYGTDGVQWSSRIITSPYSRVSSRNVNAGSVNTERSLLPTSDRPRCCECCGIQCKNYDSYQVMSNANVYFKKNRKVVKLH